MMTKDNDINEGIASLGQNHKEILGKAEQLYDALTNLRYEGKVNFGKNLSEVKKILDYFHEKFLPHMRLEDNLFSFITTHIPKLESVIRLLQAEHKELRVNLEVLQFLFKDLQEEKSEFKRTQAIEKLKDKGIYLIYLMRTHIQVEDESVFRGIGEELHPEEKKELFKRVKEFKYSAS